MDAGRRACLDESGRWGRHPGSLPELRDLGQPGGVLLLDGRAPSPADDSIRLRIKLSRIFLIGGPIQRRLQRLGFGLQLGYPLDQLG